jgi:hypothetical protein
VVADRLRDGIEDDAGLSQLLLEGGDHGNAVEHGVDGHARAILHPRQDFAFLERNAEPVVGAQQLGINVLEDFGASIGRPPE